MSEEELENEIRMTMRDLNDYSTGVQRIFVKEAIKRARASLAARLKEAEDTILELYDPGYGRDCPGVRYFQKHNPDRNK